MYIYNLINLVKINSFDSEDMTVTREYQLSVFLLLLIHQTLKSYICTFYYILFEFSNFLLIHDVQVL